MAARDSSPVTTNVTRSPSSVRRSRAVASATTKLAHSTKINGPQQARRVDCVEARHGRAVFERYPLRVAIFERHGFVQRLGKNDLFRPLSKGPGSDRESAHDVDHDRHGRGLDQISDAKETSVHPVMIAQARAAAKPIPSHHHERAHRQLITNQRPTCSAITVKTLKHGQVRRVAIIGWSTRFVRQKAADFRRVRHRESPHVML